MKYQGVIKLTQKEKNYVNHLLNDTPQDESECFGEDERYSKSFTFPNGHFVVVEICGVQFQEDSDNLPWTQGVLYNEDGREETYTEPECEFIGEWYLQSHNNEYVVVVQ